MELTRESLQLETEKVMNAITDPVFLSQMQKFRATPVEKRFEMASLEMTPDALRAMGASIPQDLRVSSRTFEEGPLKNWPSVDMEEGKRILDLIAEKRPELLDGLRIKYPDIYDDIEPIRKWPRDTPFPLPKPLDPEIGIGDDPYNAGKWACACGGAATVCGGAGGGE